MRPDDDVHLLELLLVVAEQDIYTKKIEGNRRRRRVSRQKRFVRGGAGEGKRPSATRINLTHDIPRLSLKIYP